MRFFKRLFIFLFLAAIIIYVAGGYISRELLKKGLEYAEPELASYGISISNFEYGNVRLHSLNSFSVQNVDIKFDLEKEIYGQKSFYSEFFAKTIIVHVSNIKDPTIKLTLKEFDLYIQSKDDKPDKPFGKFEKAYWKGEAPIRLYDIKESGELIIEKLRTLFKENSISDPMEFNGQALLNMDGRSFKIRMFTERRDRRTFLFFNKDDIMAAAENLEEDDLSEEEAELISKYPARTLHLLKITRDARRISKSEKSKQIEFPEDAFKHVYWSYHLTRTFGSEFAEEITNAHETLPNNTPQQRKMDFNNNEIGRNLAIEKLSIEEIKNIVLKSPEVIRSPEEVR